MDVETMNSAEALLKVNDTLRKYQISFNVFLIIAVIEEEALTLTGIGCKLKLSTAAMTTIRDSAVDKGFAERMDHPDRRKFFCQITDLGRELLASVRQ